MYFEIVTASGGYRARIRGGNHEIMFHSEVYVTKASAMHAVAVVKAGAVAVIQPGGSVRDDEVIAAADAHGVAMVLTGVRHFRH